MDNQKYFRLQADNLRKLAQSIKDPAKAQAFLDMAADFRNRADQLSGGDETLGRPALDGGSSTGEMDAD
jgi:hypothetical protein